MTTTKKLDLVTEEEEGDNLPDIESIIGGKVDVECMGVTGGSTSSTSLVSSGFYVSGSAHMTVE